MTTYIDFHVLQLVPPSCINRDDTGSPKSARFGGVERHRVSSQAWKRAIRAEFENLLESEELGERTKLAFDRIQELRPELPREDALTAATKVLAAGGIKADKKHPDQTSYLLFLSRAEIQRLAELALTVIDGEKVSGKEVKNALGNKAAVDVALFGRMLADAPERNIDASCQVQHSLSVHKSQQEFDYFTAVDDNAREDQSGAGMIGTVEFVSSTLYRYATINLDRLLSNVGDATAAKQAVAAFGKAFVTSMPTGKQNSFANRTRPDLLLVEVRSDQPTSLVNAFETPVENEGHALSLAAKALLRYAKDSDHNFGSDPEQSFIMVTDRVKDEELQALISDRAQELKLPEILERLATAVPTAEQE